MFNKKSKKKGRRNLYYMNRKFVSKSNFVLRKVLNSKDNLDILQDFIESFLKIKIKKIKLNPYLKSRENYLPKEENFGIADVRVTLENEEEYNIGIQFIDGYYVQNKMLLYYAQIHANQLQHKNTKKVARTITINMLDFCHFSSEECHKKIFLDTNLDKYGKSEKMEFHVIELPKFHFTKEEKITREKAWLIYLTGNRRQLVEEVKQKYEKIDKLDKLLENYWKEEIME